MRGWEILGRIGTVFTYNGGSWVATNLIKTNAKVGYLSKMGISGANNNLEENSCEYSDFCGGWGGATFTFSGLVQRAIFGMARFSDCTDGFPWIKYLGGYVTMMQGREVSYLAKFSTHHGLADEYAKETKWVTPGALLNQPGTILVPSLKDSRCCRRKHLRLKPPPGIEGWYDKDKFVNFILVSYWWTAFDIFDPLGPQPLSSTGEPIKTNTGTNIRLQNNWFNDKLNCPAKGRPVIPYWTNRDTYDKKYVDDKASLTVKWWNILFDSTTTWFNSENYPRCAPFLPPWITTGGSDTLWFRYKFYFQVGGSDLQNHVPQYPVHEVDDPPVCTQRCPARLDTEDFDSDGIITDRALERITRPGDRRRDLAEELKCALYQKIREKLIKRRRRVHFGPPTYFG